MTARFLSLVALVVGHAFLFVYAWSAVGFPVHLEVASATHSFPLATAAASIVTALVITLPTAFLAGLVADPRHRYFVVAAFAVAWAVLCLYSFATEAPDGPWRLIPLMFELAAISLVGLVFVTLGLKAAASRRESA